MRPLLLAAALLAGCLLGCLLAQTEPQSLSLEPVQAETKRSCDEEVGIAAKVGAQKVLRMTAESLRKHASDNQTMTVEQVARLLNGIANDIDVSK